MAELGNQQADPDDERRRLVKSVDDVLSEVEVWLVHRHLDALEAGERSEAQRYLQLREEVWEARSRIVEMLVEQHRSDHP